MRLSYGLGVVLRLGGIARLELNYVIPVRYQSNIQGFTELIYIVFYFLQAKKLYLN
jgi:hypothetical protein